MPAAAVERTYRWMWNVFGVAQQPLAPGEDVAVNVGRHGEPPSSHKTGLHSSLLTQQHAAEQEGWIW